MLQLTFQHQQLNGLWETVEVDCLSYERKGLGLDMRIAPKKYLFYDPVRRIEVNDTELMKLQEKRWKEGKDQGHNINPGKRYRAGNYPDQPEFFKGITFVGNILHPDMLVCSFCGDAVIRQAAHHGTGKLQKSRKMELNPITGEVEEKIVHFTTKVVACRNCADHIKPITRLECKVCGQSKRKCECGVFDGHHVIVKQQANTWSEG